MEFWTNGIELVVHAGKIKPIKMGHEEISHLLFADDMLVFTKRQTINELLKLLNLNTDLQINK